MLLFIAIAFVVLWFLGFLAFHVASGAIHILLGLAIILFIAHLFSGARRTAI